MGWWLAGLLLFVVGLALRRFLTRDSKSSLPRGGLLPLSGERAALYQPVALEVETQAAILGISLNDAFEERDAGHHEVAWRLVRLAVCEWDRLAALLNGLLNGLASYLGRAPVVMPVRSVAAHRFKSQVMNDYLRMHELLDRLVFRSRARFQLQIRLLRRATETLTGEFRRAYRYAERTSDRPPELWKQLDLYFHDFDLVTKETLLAFRALVTCLPPDVLPEFDADLKVILRRGVRATFAPVDP